MNNEQIPMELVNLYRVFRDNGFVLYLVGGAVRDIIMKLIPDDYDFVTDAFPEQTIELLKTIGAKIYIKGQQYGVIGAKLQSNLLIEIATMRTDTSDIRKTDIQFTNKLEDDAMRRDLTYNAIYYDIEKNIFIDYTDGLIDLNKGIIRLIGNPYKRLEDDKLRILRILRYATKYGHTIEPITYDAILTHNTLEGLSKERIYNEVINAFATGNFDVYLSYLKDFNLFKEVFPGLNVNYDKPIGSKSFPIHLAYILRNNSDLFNKLIKLKYDIKTINMTQFLIDLIDFDPKKLIEYFKLRKKYNISKDMLREWINLMNLGIYQEHFIDYIPIVNKLYIKKLFEENIIKSTTLSKEDLNDLEYINFTNLLK